jgi:AcrR family transcriptional regulator
VSDDKTPFDERILRAARQEIVDSGILGLRVLDVAEIAGCSVALIYRYFNDRDGLLAAALERFYLEDYDRMFRAAEERLGDTEKWSIDDVVAIVPKPHFPGSEKRNTLRAELYAASAHNPVLREQLERHMRRYRARLEELSTQIVGRLPADQRFDFRLFTHFIFNQNWVQNDLLGDAGITNRSYDEFLRLVLERLRIS